MARFIERLRALLRPKYSGAGLSAQMLKPLERRLLIITSDRCLTVEQQDNHLAQLRKMAPRWDVVILQPGFKAHEAAPATPGGEA